MSKLKTELDNQEAARAAGKHPASKQPGVLQTLVERLRRQGPPKTQKRRGHSTASLGPARNRAEARAQMFDTLVAVGGKGGSFHHQQGPERRSRKGRRRKAALSAKHKRQRAAAAGGR